ncbi:TPA_asm: hypothetical protein [Trichoplax MELD virus]|nr:TPA_asm: hypothetical protein [Trichoplax MELD virus]
MDDETALQVLFKKENDDEQMEMDSVQSIDNDRIKESFFVFQNMNYLGTDDTDHMVKIVNEAIHGYAKYWIDLYVRCLKHNNNVYVSLMNNDSEVMRKLETAFPEINTDDIPKIPRISFLNVPIEKTKRKRTSSGSQESEIIKELHEKWQPATHGLIRTLSDLSVQPKTLDDCKTKIDECEQRMQTNDRFILYNAFRYGRYLYEAKAVFALEKKYGSGNFNEWINSNCHVKKSRAHEYINFYDSFEKYPKVTQCNLPFQWFTKNGKTVLRYFRNHPKEAKKFK